MVTARPHLSRVIVHRAALVAGILGLFAGCTQIEEQPTILSVPIAYHVTPIGNESAGFGSGSDLQVLPASTVKIVTAAAVMERGDPDHRFVTRVCRNADSIVIIGGGDPTLDVEDMLSLALHTQSGVQDVETLTYYPPKGFGSIARDQPADAAYNPVLASLMVAEGAYRGHRDANASWSVPEGALVPPTGGTDWYAHPDPPKQAADLFRSYMRGLGLYLRDPKPAANDRCDTEITRHESEPLTGMVREMLWTSSNPMAELLGRRFVGSAGPGTWLKTRYPDLSALATDTFSGLDASARISPRAMALFLAREAGLGQGQGGLPPLLTPAGWDGGLKNRFLEPPLALNLWAKTGTLHYGVGLAGYMLVPDKGLYALAVYAFDPTLRAQYDSARLLNRADAEAEAKVWVRRARAEIDATVKRLFADLTKP